MKPAPFEYARAASLADALELLRRHGADARPLAGGQSLVPLMAFRMAQPSVLVDITRVAELQGVAVAGDRLRIGALTTHAELARDPLVARHAPLLTAAARLVAHPAIRNRGTIGGSLALADPAAELPATVLALDGEMIAVSAAGERQIKAADFVTGTMSTSLGEGELLKAIEVPLRQGGQRAAIEEIVRRSGDFAMAGAAVVVTTAGGAVAGARIAMFGVADRAVRAEKAAAALAGRTLDGAAIAAAQDAMAQEIDPMADQHGSADAKRQWAESRARTRAAAVGGGDRMMPTQIYCDFSSNSVIPEFYAPFERKISGTLTKRIWIERSLHNCPVKVPDNRSTEKAPRIPG